MIETLFPIKLPPGMLYAGTPYQSKGRWRIGSLVRFFQGDIQPIGGWVQRSLTGATVSGVPNAAISWQHNDGNKWLAVGTSTNLYVVSSANVVTNITPTTGFSLAGNPCRWQLTNFGSYLLAVYNGTGTNPSGSVNMFYWTGDTATVAVQTVALVSDSPSGFLGVVATPERFLMALQGADPVTIGTNPQRLFRAQKGGATVDQLID